MHLSEVKVVNEQYTTPPCTPGRDSGPKCSDSKPAMQENQWTREGLYKSLKLDEIQVAITDAERRRRLKEVLWEYRSCFAYDGDGFGCCNMFQEHITLKNDYTPTWVPERKISYKLEEKMDDLMENLLLTGVVEPLTTESSWNSPLMLVVKSKPGEYRVCVDLRQVNRQCLEDKYDLPNLNNVLDRIGGG